MFGKSARRFIEISPMHDPSVRVSINKEMIVVVYPHEEDGNVGTIISTLLGGATHFYATERYDAIMKELKR